MGASRLARLERWTMDGEGYHAGEEVRDDVLAQVYEGVWIRDVLRKEGEGRD